MRLVYKYNFQQPQWENAFYLWDRVKNDSYMSRDVIHVELTPEDQKYIEDNAERVMKYDLLIAKNKSMFISGIVMTSIFIVWLLSCIFSHEMMDYFKVTFNPSMAALLGVSWTVFCFLIPILGIFGFILLGMCLSSFTDYKKNKEKNISLYKEKIGLEIKANKYLSAKHLAYEGKTKEEQEEAHAYFRSWCLKPLQ